MCFFFGEKLEFPAITFCVDAVDAWKAIDELKILTEANISHSESVVQKRCYSSSTEDVIHCIKARTYTLEEIVIRATSKFLNNLSATVNVMNAKFWSSSFTQPEFGTCHKFYHPPIEKDVSVAEAPQFSFTLNSSLTHNIFIHDPKFFMLMMNPSIIPGIVQEVSKPGRNAVLTWQYLATSKHVKKRRRRHDCNEEKQYEFLSCVKHSLADKIGCSPHWQNISGFPTCHTKEQLFSHDQEYLLLSYMEARDIIAHTHCMFPCIYRVRIYLILVWLGLVWYGMGLLIYN